jgi:hypothetical protein
MLYERHRGLAFIWLWKTHNPWHQLTQLTLNCISNRWLWEWELCELMLRVVCSMSNKSEITIRYDMVEQHYQLLKLRSWTFKMAYNQEKGAPDIHDLGPRSLIKYSWSTDAESVRTVWVSSTGSPKGIPAFSTFLTAISSQASKKECSCTYSLRRSFTLCDKQLDVR